MFFNLLGGTGVWTKGFMFARYVLYHLSYASNPAMFFISNISFCFFL
jgi:hypothetical protein